MHYTRDITVKQTRETEKNLGLEEPLPAPELPKSKKSKKPEKSVEDEKSSDSIFASGLSKEREDEMRKRWKEEVDSDAEMEDYIH